VPNFAARIAEVAARWPDRPAIELARNDGKATETTPYALLERRAGQVGAWLLERGFRAGDRAAILADNDARWIAAYLGVLRIGGVAVPLDTAYKPAQVRAVLESCGARMFFTTPRYLDTARAGIDALDASARPGIVLLSGTAPGIVDAGAFEVRDDAPPIAPVTDADAAVILYTSGTTADPKGVVLTHANLDAERAAAFAIVDVNEHDAILGVLPLFHALAQMANLLLPLSVGARVVFLETINSSALVAALGTRGITIFACVPQFFYLIHQRVMAEAARKGALARGLIRLLVGLNVWLRDHAGVNPGRRIFSRVHHALGTSMRLLITGGSRFDPAIGRDLYGLGFTILNAYGLTETSGGATMVRPGDRFTTSVGQAFPGVEIRIAGGTSDFEVRPSNSGAHDPDSGSDGEILIRGPILMREYFRRPDATGEALRDGWLHTGDLGRLDKDGRLYITGRKKEIIVLSSGKNLYPEEIEAHYRQSPFFKEVCVLGLARPGQPASERLHAVIVPDEQVLKDRGIVNLRELVRFEVEGLSVQLPAHKRILSYDISLEPLPRTTTGKIRRHEVERRVHERAATSADATAKPLSDEDRAWLAAGNAEAVSVIAARLSRPDVSPQANLELDLGLDSMERVELLTDLEQRQGTRVPAEVRATIFTVRQLVDAVRVAPAAGGSAGAEADLAWDALLATPADPALVENLQRPKYLTAAVLFVALKVFRLVAFLVLRFRASGQQHVPKDGPFIISPNHQAYVDGLFVASALPFRTLRQLFVVGAAEYFASPFMRWLARRLNIVPVDSDAHLVSAMRAGAAGLRMKKVLILFPEGERSIDGGLKKFRKGAAILSAHLQAPIVPVALDGLYDLWPRGRSLHWAGLLPWRAKPVTVEFGPSLQAPRGDYAAATATLKAAVARMFDRLRPAARSDAA
jgi:long-chain acyl-CoA synthetase